MALPKALNAEENRSLLTKARAGDKAARDELITGNLRIVAKTLWYKLGMSPMDPRYNDCFQTGCEGLMKAAEYFDPDYGTEFSTYAYAYIKGHILRYMQNDNPFSFGIAHNHGGKRLAALSPAKNYLYDEEGNELSIFDIITDESASLEGLADNLDLERAIGRLRPREKTMIYCRFFLEMSEEETGRAIGVSQSNTSKILRKALEKLRRYYRGQTR